MLSLQLQSFSYQIDGQPNMVILLCLESQNHRMVVEETMSFKIITNDTESRLEI